MAAARYDLVIEQGATFTRTITVTGWNLTGYTIRMMIRPNLASNTVTLTATNGTDAQIVVTNAANGIFVITLTAAVTAALAITSDSVYDLELAVGTNPVVVTRLLYGKVTVTGEVTR